jgi:hypothetical protein
MMCALAESAFHFALATGRNGSPTADLATREYCMATLGAFTRHV